MVTVIILQPKRPILRKRIARPDNHRISSGFSPRAYFKYVPVANDNLKPHILKRQPTESSPVSILPRLWMIDEELIKDAHRASTSKDDNLEAQPEAKQDVLGTEIQCELFPMVIGRKVLVLAEQKNLFSQIAL